MLDASVSLKIVERDGRGHVPRVEPRLVAHLGRSLRGVAEGRVVALEVLVTVRPGSVFEHLRVEVQPVTGHLLYLYVVVLEGLFFHHVVTDDFAPGHSDKVPESWLHGHLGQGHAQVGLVK